MLVTRATKKVKKVKTVKTVNYGTKKKTRPKSSDFSVEKIHSMPSFGGKVKSSVPCRRFAACKNFAIYVEVGIAGQIDRSFLAQFRPSLTEVSNVA
jgi:hypothetical protein